MMEPSKRSRARKALSYALRALTLAVLGGTLFWFVRTLDLPAVGRTLARASWEYVSLGVLLTLAGIWAQALRLRLLTAPTRRVSTWKIARYLLASHAANNLLPARAGEVLRVYLMRVREGVAATTSVALILVERAAEMVTLVCLVVPLPMLLPSLPATARRVIMLATLGVVVGAAILALSLRWSRGRLSGWIARLFEAFRAAGSPSLVAATLGLSMVNWLLECVAILAILRALDLQAPLVAPFLVVFSINLAIALPTTPAQVGAYELGAAAALGFVGVEGEHAVAAAILCHAIQVVPSTLLGISGVPLALAARKAQGES